MNYKWIASGLITVMIGVTASSARSQNSPQPLNIKVDCNTAQTQSQINFCAAEQARVADRRLNQVYQQAIAKFKGTPTETQLVDAQLAWIKFRDASCAFERDRFKGGSIAPTIYSSCVGRLTQQRTKDLEDYLSE